MRRETKNLGDNRLRSEERGTSAVVEDQYNPFVCLIISPMGKTMGIFVLKSYFLALLRNKTKAKTLHPTPASNYDPEG